MKSIDEYLEALEKELTGSDPATIRDARTDAEEHLRTAVETLKENNPHITEGEAVTARKIWGTGLLFCMALSNHPAILFMIPMYLLLVSVSHVRLQLKAANLVRLVAFCFLGFTAYALLLAVLA